MRNEQGGITFAYQWLRVILRYQLAAILAIFAFVMIFDLKFRFPALSEMNTNYGDFTPAKIFQLTLGIAKANYKLTVGLVELLAAVLLLFRRTAAVGALMAAGIILNIVLADFAYNTGDQYISLYLMIISLILLAHNLPGMYRLMLEKPAVANNTNLKLNPTWERRVRPALKALFIVLILASGITAYIWKQQSPRLATGLPNAAGLYDVAEFKWNGTTIPYSKSSPHRWQNVVFETWKTISILQPGSKTCGRTYYVIKIDSVLNRLYLQDQGDHRSIQMTLLYNRPDTSTIILSGRTSHRDSIYAVLKKIDKKYLLIQGRRKPVEL